MMNEGAQASDMKRGRAHWWWRVIVSVLGPGIALGACATPDGAAADGGVEEGQVSRASERAVTSELGMEFVFVEPGTFEMGSPVGESGRGRAEKQHVVELSRGCYVGVTEVTVGQFRQFVEATGYRTTAEVRGWDYAWDADTDTYAAVDGASWRASGFERGDDHPVGVSWFDAVEFCSWLSAQYNAKFRLPTEAEWEYVCRAGGQSAYQWGDNPDDGEGWCNGADLTALERFGHWKEAGFDVFSWSDGYVFSSPVASFRANKWGVYDMHGNMSEWCADWYGDYPDEEVTDPGGPKSGTHRVLRGGAWDFFPSFCRCAHRFYAEPDSSGQDLGFRVVLELCEDGAAGSDRSVETE